MEEIADWLVEAYEKEGKVANWHEPLAQATADKISEAVNKGWAKIDSQKAGSFSAQLAQTMRENVYVFSGAKTATELRELGGMLVGKDKVRSLGEFKKAVKAVHSTYKDIYLPVEYKQALAGSMATDRWMQIQEDAEALPYLKYTAVPDDRVRAEHLNLNGVIKKVNDRFWDIYYPPNGWGCRCSVEQLPDGTPTDLRKIALPEVKPMFVGNVGKTGVLFDSKHPYFTEAKQAHKDFKTESLKMLYKNDYEQTLLYGRNEVIGKKSVRNVIDGFESIKIEFDTNTFNENLKNGDTFPERRDALKNIVSLMKEAKFSHTEAVQKEKVDKKKHVKSYHVYTLEAETCNFTFKVENDAQDKNTLHHIFVKKKAKK